MKSGQAEYLAGQLTPEIKTASVGHREKKRGCAQIKKLFRLMEVSAWFENDMVFTGGKDAGKGMTFQPSREPKKKNAEGEKKGSLNVFGCLQGGQG